MSEKSTGEPSGPVRIVRKLALLYPEVSGTRLKRAVTEGQVLVDGTVVRDPGAVVMQGSKVQWDVNKKIERNVRTTLTVLFEDDDAIAVMKPAGLLTHPTEAKEKETLLGRVSTYVARKHKERGYVSVVHRLDKETSGILVFARSRRGMVALQAQLRAHSMDRRYQAVVEGDIQPDQGIIDRDLVEDRGDRRRGVARPGETGIRAVTEWKVLERFGIATLIEAKLQTGRTHQIRVHFANSGHSLVGDPVYRNPNHPAFPIPFPRQALHAGRLGWTGPDGKVTVVEAPPPADFLKLLALLRAKRPRTMTRPAAPRPAVGGPVQRSASARPSGASAAAPTAARPLGPPPSTGIRATTAHPISPPSETSRPETSRTATSRREASQTERSRPPYRRPAGAPPPRATSAPRTEGSRGPAGRTSERERQPDAGRGPDFRKRTDARPASAGSRSTSRPRPGDGARTEARPRPESGSRPSRPPTGERPPADARPRFDSDPRNDTRRRPGSRPGGLKGVTIRPPRRPDRDERSARPARPERWERSTGPARPERPPERATESTGTRAPSREGPRPPSAGPRPPSRGGAASPGRPQKGFPRGPKRDPRRP